MSTTVQRLNSTAQNTVPPRAADSRQERTGPAETVTRLQRGILRLALAYHGQNQELDARLKKLGGLLRSGKRDATLQTLIDEIVDTIVSLDLDRRGGAPDEATPATDDLLECFLAHLEVPGAGGAELESLRALLAAKREAAERLTAVEQTARALSASLSGNAPAAESLAPARNVVIELLERISVPSGLTNEATALRHAALQAEDTAAIKSCVSGLADLVCRMRDALQSELDNLAGFLRSTAQRLQEFERYVSYTRDLHSEASSDALQLSETMCGSIDGLRGEVSASEDLEAVKHLIEERLDTINEDLDRFVSTQKARATEASDTIDKMVNKLQDLEAEAEHLRDDLEEQHARVLLDPLTGVLNRAGYQETAGKQFARWKRYGGALSLAVIDLDLFKHINDEYGHAAGDKVLSTVATKIVESIRESDILCRYGGEEFVLLLPETNMDDAIPLLDKLRSEIERCPFRYKETPVSVTLSCGVAQFTRNETLDDVFERADQAMYEAKDAGRNQVRASVPAG